VRALAPIALVAVLGLVAGCEDAIEAGGSGDEGEVEPDPLAVPEPTDDGSLDTLYRTVIGKRCSGEPGLCHNGQFEPNLSTPALTYLYMVNRPSIENRDRLRVSPGAPESSFLIDKLRNRNGVASQMPLGADPLAEEEIRAIEDWIASGARRGPSAEAAPELNNPPLDPEIGVFDAVGQRLDTAGAFSVSAGESLTFRHSVEDYEVDDAAMPFALFLLQTASGALAVSPGSDDPELAVASYDGDGPMGNGDQLNYRFEYTIPAQVDLIDPDTGAVVPDVPTSGMVIDVVAVYVDTLTAGEGFAAFSIEAGLIAVE